MLLPIAGTAGDWRVASWMAMVSVERLLAGPSSVSGCVSGSLELFG